jgi:hypothetical protein
MRIRKQSPTTASLSDVWIKDLDGETIYKGKLPMDWMEDCPVARRMKKLWDSHAFGNRNEIFFEFEMDIDNNSDDEATFVVRYEAKDGGLEATLVCFTVFSGAVD